MISPQVQELLTEFFDGKTLCQALNPDEAVAYGAAVQAAIMCGTDSSLDDVILLDVAPLSLGIETVGGIFSPIIKRNTNIPTTTSKMFSTHDDDQTTVPILVYEGERTTVKVHSGGTFART
jgi:heat shock 70kDa protein 1/2/6/8